MHQSIPAGNIPRATPGDSHILSPRFFPKKFCLATGGLDRVRIFPKLIINLQFVSIVCQRFQEAGKINIKSNNIVFETNATKPFRIKMSSNIYVIRTDFC